MKYLVAMALFMNVFAAEAQGSKADINCTAVYFDIQQSGEPTQIAMKLQEGSSDEYFQVFQGKFKDVDFRVVYQSLSAVANSYIVVGGVNEQGAAASEFTSKSGFDSNGRFELSVQQGGNIMMPAKLFAISCEKQSKSN